MDTKETLRLEDGYVAAFEGTPLYILDPPPKEAVIVHYVDRNNIEKSMFTHGLLVKTFPNNTVIAIPDECAVMELDKESAIDALESLIRLVKGE